MFKLSNYLIEVPIKKGDISTELLLYSTRTCESSIVTDTAYRLMSDGKFTQLPEKLFVYFVKKEIIVLDLEEESQVVKKRNICKDNLALVVNPYDNGVDDVNARISDCLYSNLFLIFDYSNIKGDFSTTDYENVPILKNEKPRVLLLGFSEHSLDIIKVVHAEELRYFIKDFHLEQDTILALLESTTQQQIFKRIYFVSDLVNLTDAHATIITLLPKVKSRVRYEVSQYINSSEKREYCNDTNESRLLAGLILSKRLSNTTKFSSSIFRGSFHGYLREMDLNSAIESTGSKRGSDYQNDLSTDCEPCKFLPMCGGTNSENFECPTYKYLLVSQLDQLLNSEPSL